MRPDINFIDTKKMIHGVKEFYKTRKEETIDSLHKIVIQHKIDLLDNILRGMDDIEAINNKKELIEESIKELQA